MAGKKREKGPYRALYEALPDDPDFQELSGVARALFYPLRLKLGVAGIGIFYPEQLPRLTGFTLEQTDAALAEMERADWIRREGSIIWIRNGVRHDPMEPLASPNGRKGIEHYLRSLPKRAIVNDFARYYGLTLPYPDIGQGTAPTQAPASAPTQAPSEGVGQHGRRKTEDGEQHSVGYANGGEPRNENSADEPEERPAPPPPPPPEQPPEEDEEPTLQQAWGDAAGIIRTTFPNGKMPHRIVDGRPWTMGREQTAWMGLAKHVDTEVLNMAIRIACGRCIARREVFTLQFFTAATPKAQGYYNEMLAAAEKRLEEAA